MTFEESNDYDTLSVTEKKRKLYEQQIELLNNFYQKNAISKESYEKGINEMQKRLERLLKE